MEDQGKKILVADDDQELLDLVVMALQQEGHQVMTASDGQKAIKALQMHTFDLVIFDVMMPNATGLEVASQASTKDNPPKIITMSGKKNLKSGQLAWAGVDVHIDKPFEISEFLKVVQRLLDEPPIQSAA